MSIEFDYSKQPGLRRYRRDLVTDGEPLVTIITPFYNGGQYIEQTFNCVVNQTFPWFEWIIVNDGSTKQEDVAFVEALAQTDERVRVVHKENGGISTARNYGLRLAKAPYTLMLDCDDLIEPTYVEYCWWMLEKNPDAVWAYTDSCGFQNIEYLWEKAFDPVLLKRENHLTATSLFRKKALEQMDGYSEVAKNYNEDWYMYLRLVAAGNFPVQSKGEILFWYRRRDNGVLSIVSTQAEENAFNKQLIKNACADVIDPPAPVIYPRGSFQFDAPHASAWQKSIFKQHKKLHITLLTAWLEMGGADKFNLDLLSGLDPERFEVSILTTVPSGNAWQQQFRQVTPDVFNLPNFVAPKDYAEFITYFLRSRETDVLLITNSYHGYYLAPWLRENFPALAIVDYIHMEEWYWRAGGYARSSGALAAVFEKTYVCNSKTKQVMETVFNRKPESVETVHIGVDHRLFDRSRVREGIVYQRLGIESGRPIVLFICRLHPQKRPFMMVKIAEQVKARIPDVAFVVVGDGPLGDALAECVQNANLTDTVYFAGSESEVRPYYRDAKATLICSLKEGLALTAYESCSMGVPVVSADVGGQSDLIDNTVGALIPCQQKEGDDFCANSFPKAEVAQYAEAIVRLLTDSALWEKSSRNCRAKVEQAFSIDAMVAYFEKEFTRLAADASLRAARQHTADMLSALSPLAADYFTMEMQMQAAEDGHSGQHHGSKGRARGLLFGAEFEKQLDNLEETVNRHEEVVNRHEQVVNDDWAWLKDLEKRMRFIEKHSIWFFMKRVYRKMKKILKK